ncbi:MAG: PLDc N-terminal domain-containing protein [Phycisphaerae bacterium]|nr:PLDc N-terminal domain-containing protein [Phycisphaerae bacterium]
MDEERRRILRMMAEGTISVEECDELLRALSDRRKEKTEKEVQAAQTGSRPVWPYVLLVVLAILALPVGLATFGGLLGGTVWRFGPMPGFRAWFPCVFLLAPIRILLFIFWVWMLVDCLSRLPCDFRLLFTSEHKYDKWIWLGIVILVFPIGAIVYFFLIRQPARQIAPPSSKEKPPSAPKPPAPPERPLRPSRRARSIKALVIITIILALCFPVVIVLGRILFGRAMQPTAFHHVGPQLRMTGVGLVIIPTAIIVLIWLIFWICMLIDCLARDYREFGTLITSDKSADKLVWVLLILFLPIIGAIAYHIAIRRRAVSA